MTDNRLKLFADASDSAAHFGTAGSVLTGALAQTSDIVDTGLSDDAAGSIATSVAGQRQSEGGTATRAAGEALDLLILGDSLTVDPSIYIGGGSSFGDILDAKLTAKGENVDITALSTSGFRTDQGLAALQDYFDNGGATPDAVIVELGTNDAIQKVASGTVASNLDAILTLLENEGVDAVLVAGAYGQYPTHNGDGYTDKKTAKAFEKIFSTEAKEADALSYKYFLDGVLKKASTLTVDGLHPNAAGAEIIAGKMTKVVQTLLNEAEGGGGARSHAGESHGSVASLDHLLSSVSGESTS